jgi:hypothetical protein
MSVTCGGFRLFSIDIQFMFFHARSNMKFKPLQTVKPFFRAVIGAAITAPLFIGFGTSSAAIVVIEQLRCTTMPAYRDVNIYRAGSIKSGENIDVGSPTCANNGPIGACMTEPFKDSVPFSIRNSSITNSNTTSSTTMCHTIKQSDTVSKDIAPLVLGIYWSRGPESAPFMKAGASDKKASINFIYSLDRSTLNSVAASNGGDWKELRTFSHLFKTAELAEAHLKNVSVRVRVPSGPAASPEQAETAAREGLQTLGCSITPTAGRYACHDDRALKFCLAEGINTGVAKVCVADFKADVSGKSATCKPFLGRADEQLCFEPGGFASCKSDVDAGKYKSCLYNNDRYAGKSTNVHIPRPGSTSPAAPPASGQVVKAGCAYDAAAHTASCPTLISYNKCRSLIENNTLKGCGANFAQINTGDMKTCVSFLGRPDEKLCKTEEDYRECIAAVRVGQMKTCRHSGSADSLYPPAKK